MSLNIISHLIADYAVTIDENQIIDQAAKSSIYQEIKNLFIDEKIQKLNLFLLREEPLTVKEIGEFYLDTKVEVLESPDLMEEFGKDQHRPFCQSPFCLISRLYFAFFSHERFRSSLPGSSTHAVVINQKVGEVFLKSFVYKTQRLQECGFKVSMNQGAVNERIAYILGRNFASIPPTYLIQDGSELGSIQHYVEKCQSIEDGVKRVFNTDTYRRNKILSLLMVNLDPNQEIFSPEGISIAIDFGYSLPEELAVKSPRANAYLYLPCLKTPFSEAEKVFIRNLSEESIATILKKYTIPDSAIQIQRRMILLLKTAVEISKLTLFDLLKLFYYGLENNYYGGWNGPSIPCQIRFSFDLMQIMNASEKTLLPTIHKILNKLVS